MSLALLYGVLLGVARASTNAYDLSVEMTLNGKSLVSPHLVVREGEVREIGNDPGSFVEVLAVEGSAQGHDGIYMQFVVGTKSADGHREVVSRPRILVHENESATITVGDGGRGTVALSVVAQRRTLR